MAASVVKQAFGTLLKSGDGGGSEVFSTIAEVRDITLPNFSTAVEDVTHQTSPNAHTEQIATLKSSDAITFECNFIDDATQGFSSGLLADWANRTKRNYQVVVPLASPKTWGFAAYVTGFQVTAAFAGVLRANVTLTVASAPSLA